MNNAPYISVQDAAEMSGRSQSTIKALAVAGKLGRSFKPGQRAWVIEREAVKNLPENPGKGRPKLETTEA